MSVTGVASSKPLLLERDAELRELEQVVQAAVSGEGRAVLIEGPAGAGKSSLLAAAAALAPRAGVRALRARGSELEREFAFGLMRQLLEPLLAEADARERERLLAGAAAIAERVILPPAEAAGAPASDTAAVLHALQWLVANAAAGRPLLLAVDDAHWADVSSLRALSYLAGRLSGLPVALAAAFRPAEPGAPEDLLDQLRAEPGTLRLSPAALSENGVAGMVHARHPAAKTSVCEAISSETGGNPLLVEELLRELSAGGGLTGPEAIAEVRAASMPLLGERVARRIAPQGERAPGLAAAMAVLGDRTSLDTAAALAGLPLDEAGEIAHRLRRIEVLWSEDPVSFVHPLIRRSVYDALSTIERNTLHTSAAELLREAGAPAENVAVHRATVAPNGSSTTATALMDAAESALARAAPDEAIRWFRRALEEDADDPPRGTILAGLGMAQVLLRDTEAIATLHAALGLIEEPLLRMRVAATLAEIMLQAGHWERGMEVVTAAGEELGDADPELKAQLHDELAAVRAAIMAHDPALIEDFDRELGRFTELAQQGDSWPAHALAAVLAATAARRGQGAAEVSALVDRALEGGTLLGERGGGWASVHVIGALVLIDDYQRALALCEEVIAAGHRDGSLTGVISGLGSRAWIHARQGDLVSAETEMRSAVTMARQAQTPMADVTALFYLQDALLERPSLADVAELAETIELDPTFASTWTGGMLAVVRGRLRVARLERESGVRDLRTATAIHNALHMGPTVVPARSELALALPAADRDEALSLVDEEVELARASGLDRPLGVALRAAGVLQRGEPGIELLRGSASLLQRVGARYERARSLVELGAALRRAGHRSDARSELTAGMELADRCGAERVVARAREEIGAAGARPRRIATTGLAALTASERRVAELAARGATNSEIAQELFVGLKTVETHLSHAYMKLGLAGRGARGRLGEALDEGRAQVPT